jgi:hypothetical protein
MTDEERNERNAQLQRTMALLVHASACANPDCPSTNCSKVKGLFHHAVSCHLKVAGGCQFCRCAPRRDHLYLSMLSLLWSELYVAREACLCTVDCHPGTSLVG